jgi:transposase
VRYWLTPAADADRDVKIADVCAVYRAAAERAEAGHRTVSTDELTHVQALERLAPDLPPRAGQVARREFEYTRHGTCSFFINFDVASGQVFSPSSGPTRTEADFVDHVRRTVHTDPAASQWHFVVDNLDIHRSESLVRYVAERDGIEQDLGVKYVRGVLRSRASRAAFLAEATHSIVFHYTPIHASWLNQVEIWLSILMRKLLRRGNFRSVQDLRDRVHAFIDYFNRTMAKPFKWTYQGKPLHA